MPSWQAICVSSASPLLLLRQEWQDWEDSIWNKFAIQAPQKHFASELAAQLKWLLQQVCQQTLLDPCAP